MTIWTASDPLILASQSAARRMLLENAGINPVIRPAMIDERSVEHASGLTRSDEVALLLAKEKAQNVSLENQSRVIVGADQTLVLGEQRFSKPADRAQAAKQLLTLAGRTHELHSAVAVARDGAIVFSDVSVARLTMRALSQNQIETYLDAAGDRVFTSVGSYQLEGLGVHLFDRIDGDHFTILGLPLLPLLKFFRREKLVEL